MIKFAHICPVVFLLALTVPLFSGCARQDGGGAPSVATAPNAPASDASLKELMELSGMRELLHVAPDQLAASMDAFAQKDLQGKAPNPSQQQAIDNMKKRFSALFATDLSYEKMEALFLPVYRETFSDEEVAGMIAFYKTPAGQAVTQKMPTLMQKTMQMQQQLMNSLMPKVEEIAQEFAKEMQAASK